MDFSKILDDWEKQKKRHEGPPPLKDEAPRRAGPSRTDMESAPIEDRLDLHGMLVDEALAELRAFLGHSQREGLAKVLVIHGKGLHSENQKSVLKEAVQQALARDRNVASWGEARRREGGQGASWVWLRSSSVRGR